MPLGLKHHALLLFLSVASIKCQIYKPEDIKPLSIPPWPDVKNGKTEEIYGGRVNITWEDGSLYSVRESQNLY